jgi:hypothetical protein
LSVLAGEAALPAGFLSDGFDDEPSVEVAVEVEELSEEPSPPEPFDPFDPFDPFEWDLADEWEALRLSFL